MKNGAKFKIVMLKRSLIATERWKSNEKGGKKKRKGMRAEAGTKGWKIFVWNNERKNEVEMAQAVIGGRKKIRYALGVAKLI